MTQEITVTKTEDHYEMQFEGNNTAYPVPTSAIDKLDADLLPEETGDSLTFIGEYQGVKHMKNFDVEEVLDAPNDDQSDEEEVEQVEEESSDEEEEEVVEVAEARFTEADVGESGKCLHSRCDDDADVAVKCDTGQIKHYCDEHNDGRRAGHALIVEEKRLTDETEENSNDGEDQDEEIAAEPTDEHVEEAGYHTAAGQAQQIEALRLFSDESDDAETDGGKRIMTDGGSTNPTEFVGCAGCDADSETWAKKRRLPQIAQTYECSECGHEVYIYDAGDPNETLRRLRPVTDSMATNLLFFAEVGDWPDSALEDLFKEGLERAEAIDYHIVENEDLSQTEWAEKTERRQPSVSENISKAKSKLDW